jgi:hypothetical protein
MKSLADIEFLFVSAMKQLQVIQDVPNYENKEMCSTCGGKCCKSLSGINSPEQFGAPDKNLLRHNLLKNLKSGRYTIDWWEADNEMPKTYYMRPSLKGREGKIKDPARSGDAACNFLTDKGCELGHEERPTECTTLEPKMKGNEYACEQKSKLDSVKPWVPYQDVMNLVLKRAIYEGYDKQYIENKKVSIKKVTDKISIGKHTFETIVAVSEEEHVKGLMGKPWPPPVMIFPYKNAEMRKFWMHKTISPLDIIFCRNNRVIGIFAGKPMSTVMLGPNEPSDLVVELPLGTAKKYGIKTGDKINIKYSIQTIVKKYERETISF